MNIETIFISNNLIEAQIIKDTLLSHNIHAVIINDNMGTLYHHVHGIGICVQVHSSEKEKAMQILQKFIKPR